MIGSPHHHGNLVHGSCETPSLLPPLLLAPMLLPFHLAAWPDFSLHTPFETSLWQIIDRSQTLRFCSAPVCDTFISLAGV